MTYTNKPRKIVFAGRLPQLNKGPEMRKVLIAFAVLTFFFASAFAFGSSPCKQGSKTAVNNPIARPIATAYNKKNVHVWQLETPTEKEAREARNAKRAEGAANSSARLAYLYREAERRGDKAYLEAHKGYKR